MSNEKHKWFINYIIDMPTSRPGYDKNMPQLIYDQMKLIKLLPGKVLAYL